jgi:hypothetical protein
VFGRDDIESNCRGNADPGAARQTITRECAYEINIITLDESEENGGALGKNCG